MTSFVLKLIAIVMMVVDHVAYFALRIGWTTTADPLYQAMRVLGRITMPLFAFLLVQGFLHTRNRKRYLLRVAVLAVLSQPVFTTLFYGRFDLVSTLTEWSILASFTFSLLLLWLLEHTKECYQQRKGSPWLLCWMPALLVSAYLITHPLLFNYGIYGVLLVVLLWLCKDQPRYVSGVMVVLLLSLYYQKSPILIAGVMVAAICIGCYKGRQGPPIKWFFYLFYPLHQVAILLVFSLLAQWQGTPLTLW